MHVHERNFQTEFLQGRGSAPVIGIGDCVNPFNIALAIRGGSVAGRAV